MSAILTALSCCATVNRVLIMKLTGVAFVRGRRKSHWDTGMSVYTPIPLTQKNQQHFLG